MSEAEIQQKLSEFKTVWEKAVYLAKLGKTGREIRQLANCSKAYAYNAINHVKKEAQLGKPETLPSEVSVKTVEVEKPVEILEEAEKAVEKPEGELEAKPSIIKGLLKGQLSSEDIESIWTSINDLLPEKYQRPQKSMVLLGKVWVSPINRYLEQYLEEHADLYVAMIVAVITFAPSLVGVVKDYRKSKEKPQPQGIPIEVK